MRAADASRCELLDRRIGERGSIGERETLEDSRGLVADVESAAPEEIAPLSPDQTERHFAPTLCPDEMACGFDHVRVEAAAESAVRSDDDEQHRRTLVDRRSQQRMRILIDAGNEAVEHSQHALCERARRDHALLRAA